MKNQITSELARQLNLTADLGLCCFLLLIGAVVFFLSPAITTQLYLR